MTPTTLEREPPLLQELPGIDDIVWAIVARVGRTRDPVRLVFVSAQASTGNTVISAATAAALARHLRVPVCLVETNIERPALADYLGLRSAGLSDVLDGRAGLDECLQSPPDCPELSVLPGGSRRRLASGEFAAESMRSLLQKLGERGRYVVLDAPPLLDHLESRLLLQHSDGTLLVLNSLDTRVDVAARAQRILLEAGAPVLGSIYNACHIARRAQLPLPLTVASSVAVPEVAAAAPTPVEPSVVGAVPPIEDASLLRSFTLEPPHPSNGSISEEAHRREVELLQRRIDKLTLTLEQTEAELRRVAKLKNVDLGIASIYRTVQGLSSLDEALALKKALMKDIFEANLELKHVIDLRASRRAAMHAPRRTGSDRQP